MREAAQQDSRLTDPLSMHVLMLATASKRPARTDQPRPSRRDRGGAPARRWRARRGSTSTRSAPRSARAPSPWLLGYAVGRRVSGYRRPSDRRRRKPAAAPCCLGRQARYRSTAGIPRETRSPLLVRWTAAAFGGWRSAVAHNDSAPLTPVSLPFGHFPDQLKLFVCWRAEACGRRLGLARWGRIARVGRSADQRFPRQPLRVHRIKDLRSPAGRPLANGEPPPAVEDRHIEDNTASHPASKQCLVCIAHSAGCTGTRKSHGRRGNASRWAHQEPR